MGLIQEFQRADAQRRKEVAALAREVAAMRADADAFVGRLHQVSADRRKGVAAMLADANAFIAHLHQVSAGRRRGVAAMLADANAFVGHLHRLSADRHTEVWGRTAPAPRAPAPPPPAAPAAAQGAPVTLGEVIRAYLGEHPEGARMTQLEQDLGMPRIKLAQAMRSLIDDNKVEKRDLLYFAI